MANVVGRLKAVLGLDDKKYKKGLDKAEKKTSKFGQQLNKIGGLIAGAFAVDQIIQFGKAIINTTAKFQKFQAVLSQTLGSDSAAQRQLDAIVDFASKTPFQVEELTDAFVKMSNRGMQPTMAEMRAMGDLAAATGKTFDQLAEAQLDAVVGEFERLKEFGIKARKEGENINFTFKGQTTTVKNTSSAIKDYLISLGNAEGVQGSMNKISKTTAGRISNMKDQWTQFKATLGQRTSGLINGVIKGLTKMVNAFNMAAKSIREVKQEARSKVVQQAIRDDREEVEQLAKRYQELGVESDEQAAKQRAAAAIMKQYQGVLDSLGPDEEQRKNQILEQLDALDSYSKKLNKVQADLVDTGEEASTTIKKMSVPDKTQATSMTPFTTEKVEPQLKNMDRIVKKTNQMQSRFSAAQAQGSMFGGVLMQAFQGMSNSISDALNNSKNALQGFWNFFKDFIMGLITKLIAAAAAAAALAALLALTTGGGSLIGAGSATGFGEIFKAGFGQLSGFGMQSGGVVPPGYPNDSYPAMLTSGETVTPPDRLPQQGGNEKLTAEISDEGLKFILDRANRKQGNTL